jgi:NADH-quinone oxidoreductase subunit H
MSINSIYGLFVSGLSSSNPLTFLVSVVAYAIIIMVIMSVFAYIFGWVERKLIAKAQYRHGPTYVGKFGILQNLADLIKLIAKEKMVPSNANRILFALAPQILVAMATLLILLLPFSPTLQATNLGVGLLAIFVILGFTPILLFIAAFSSGNKFADISGQRSVLLLISYELPMMLVIASVALTANGYNLQHIIAGQSKFAYAFIMPIGLFIFFVTMLAELERTPFDLREADSELIAGWLTDMSAPYYALSLLLDYTRMFLGGLLIAILFFGGWSGPLLPPAAWLVIKAFLIALFIIIIRVTLVRMRIDRVLRFGWAWLIPLALINLVLTYVLFG